MAPGVCGWGDLEPSPLTPSPPHPLPAPGYSHMLCNSSCDFFDKQEINSPFSVHLRWYRDSRYSVTDLVNCRSQVRSGNRKGTPKSPSSQNVDSTFRSLDRPSRGQAGPGNALEARTTGRLLLPKQESGSLNSCLPPKALSLLGPASTQVTPYQRGDLWESQPGPSPFLQGPALLHQ